MALTATMFTFDVTLSDVDRSVYEQLTLKAARHPSETDEYLWTRVLAYCLEYAEGIEFSKGGVSDPDDPPVSIRDLTGALMTWIDIGAPTAERLHRASKASPRVVVYTHKDPTILLRGWEGTRIHRSDRIELHAVPDELLASLVNRLDRRVAFTLSIAGGELYFDFGDTVVHGALQRHRLPA
jgi:uncharacterized protein YaeQ